jgi:hypothetical protein
MRRREFIKLIASSAVACPLAARAQQPGKVYRIGFLANDPNIPNAFLDGLLSGRRASWRKRLPALPARYPYIGAAEKNVYLFRPTEAERDLIVQALFAFAAAPPPNGSA